MRKKKQKIFTPAARYFLSFITHIFKLDILYTICRGVISELSWGGQLPQTSKKFLSRKKIFTRQKNFVTEKSFEEIFMWQKFLQSKEKIHILNTFFDCFEKNYHKLRQYNKNGLNSGENNLAPDFYVIFYLK